MTGQAPAGWERMERRRWWRWGGLAALGLILIALSFRLPDKANDAVIGFVTVVVPVLIGGDAHVHHAKILVAQGPA